MQAPIFYRHRFKPATWGENPDCAICGKKRSESPFASVLISKLHLFDYRDAPPADMNPLNEEGGQP
jgi:hypothetical protein